MKRYLLIVGDNYYPSAGTDDWINDFNTIEEAKNVVEKVSIEDLFKSGPRKGQVKSSRETYKVNDRYVDWYEIVDLECWTKE